MGIGIAVVMVSGLGKKTVAKLCPGTVRSAVGSEATLAVLARWIPSVFPSYSDCGSEAGHLAGMGKALVSIPALQRKEDGESPNLHAVLETLKLGFKAAFLESRPECSLRK